MLILIRKINTRGATRSQSRVSNVVLFAQSLSTSYQETIYRNAQLRYTQILYCTLWEECKQTQCPHRNWRERTTALVWYYSPTKNKLIYQVGANTYDFWLSGQYGKYNSSCNIFFFRHLGPFPSKMMRCHWILCFDLLPLQYSDLTHEIWRFLVYIFLERGKVWLYIFTVRAVKILIKYPENLLIFQ